MLTAFAGPAGNSIWVEWRESTGRWEEIAFADGLQHLSTGSSTLPPFWPEQLRAPFGGTKILCVGRNYRPHAAELGNEVPSEPLWFSKPPSSLLPHRGMVIIPANVGRVDYEGELALVIGRRLRQVSAQDAEAGIAGVTLALDMTARDLQKSESQWTRAKGFDTFCPLGPALFAYHEGWKHTFLRTTINGAVVQEDQTSSMVFGFGRLLEHLSACMTLEPGDVVLTGTPAGVGPVNPGDVVRVEVVGPVSFHLEVHCAS